MAVGKTVFAIIGMLEPRKGQDILIDAIRCLPEKEVRQSYFVFVGKKYYEPIWVKVNSFISQYPNNAVYYEQLGREDMMSLYEQIDCYICASRDDPMPVVVAEAQMSGKAVICSENTGSAEIVRKMNSGCTYENDDPVALSRCISNMLHNSFCEGIASNARNTYEEYFSAEVFEEKTRRLLSENRKKELFINNSVSVIIPTYNGEQDLSVLLPSLKSQKNINSLETIVVDSESTDNTKEICLKYGCKYIAIKHDEFSHSGARNLGAEEASGDYLLFMTQDALPFDDYWVARFVASMSSADAVAATCVELPKEDCDLLSGLLKYSHLDYMGVTDANRVMKYPRIGSNDSIVKNGRLNNVACLIYRDVFERYGFRGKYAEDLDLGIRLIKSGYKLCYLSDVSVYHSHNRPPFYYLKRTLVDFLSLEALLPNNPVAITEQKYANMTVTGYVLATLFTDKLLENAEKYNEAESFKTWSSETLGQIAEQIKTLSKKKAKKTITTSNLFIDDETQMFVSELLEKHFVAFEWDITLLADLRNMISIKLVDYFDYLEIQPNETNKIAIAEFVMKYFAQLAGTRLAYWKLTNKERESYLHSKVQELVNGI